MFHVKVSNTKSSSYISTEDEIPHRITFHQKVNTDYHDQYSSDHAGTSSHFSFWQPPSSVPGPGYLPNGKLYVYSIEDQSIDVSYKIQADKL